MEGISFTPAGIFVEELAEMVAHKGLDREMAIEIMKSALYYVGDADFNNRLAVWDEGEEYLDKCIEIEKGD